MALRAETVRCSAGHEGEEFLTEAESPSPCAVHVDGNGACGLDRARVSQYETAGAPRVRAWRGVGKADRDHNL